MDEVENNKREKLESEIQKLIDSAHSHGYVEGEWDDDDEWYDCYRDDLFAKLSELLDSYYPVIDDIFKPRSKGPIIGHCDLSSNSDGSLHAKIDYTDPFTRMQTEMSKKVYDDLCKYQRLHPNVKLVPTFKKEEKPDGSVMYKIIYKPAITYDV